MISADRMCHMSESHELFEDQRTRDVLSSKPQKLIRCVSAHQHSMAGHNKGKSNTLLAGASLHHLLRKPE